MGILFVVDIVADDIYLFDYPEEISELAISKNRSFIYSLQDI
jgi:hypothetical protein